MIHATASSTSFKRLLHLQDLNPKAYAHIEGDIAPMVQLGSAIGALWAFWTCDRIGRLWAVRQLCLFWIIGIIIFQTGVKAGSLGQVYAGRLIAGIGVCQIVVVAPVYLAEISPKSIRGLCCCAFAGSAYIGIMLGYWANLGCQRHYREESSLRWMIPTSLHYLFAGLILVLSFFNLESPRCLIQSDKVEEAQTTLAKLRGLPRDHVFVGSEINEILSQLAEEQAATYGLGWKGNIKEIFCDRSNFYRLYLGFGTQLLGQWSGANCITIYATQFISIVGIQGQDKKLVATAVMGLVKLIAAMICAFFLVDTIGRKRSMYIGNTVQAFSLMYIAIFLTIKPVGMESERHISLSAKYAGLGSVIMVYLCGIGWAMGWNSIQYLLNLELYPLRIRAICSSMVMFLHFINQYGANKTAPLMLLSQSHHGLGPAGTFWFYTVVTLVGGAWAWFFIPETAGRSLESMDELFQLVWYRIGRMGRKYAERVHALGEKRTSH
jgi:sugar porter (SP) family MFS transporter